MRNDVLRNIIGEPMKRCARAIRGEEILLWLTASQVNKTLFVRSKIEVCISFQSLRQERGCTNNFGPRRVEPDLPDVFAPSALTINETVSVACKTNVLAIVRWESCWFGLASETAGSFVDRYAPGLFPATITRSRY